MKLLLVYPPFCTPASPPYSITNIHAFLRDNLPGGFSVDVLDLNIMYHSNRFKEYQQYCRKLGQEYDSAEYSKKTEEYKRTTKDDYSSNNRMVIEDKNPLLFDELLSAIKSKKPDTVAFSIVYSSQAFYAYALIKELKKSGIRTIIGGPAVNNKLIGVANEHLINVVELLGYIKGGEVDHDSLKCDNVLDFSIYPLKDYFVPSAVIPFRTSSGCYHRKCTFCTHHQGSTYCEFSLDSIGESIKASGQKFVFIVDDMVHKKRLLDIAKVMKPLGVSWMCQLRPTADLDIETLRTLKDSGLNVIIWGVESGSNRILGMMKKGTDKDTNAKVLSNSHNAGIKNVVYIMFGFPSETKEEFLETIGFLEDNNESIDLVSTSIFGLQKGTEIYEHPKEFSITAVREEKRTILDDKITYDVSAGLTHEEAVGLRKRYSKTLEKINNYPKAMNFFREHMLCI
ncbi:radical SAM protein [Candidatus Woesearchaeota archaeon]|nr:radical SAM protein [Candidatus Woesearchaeota archaeon]